MNVSESNPKTNSRATQHLKNTLGAPPAPRVRQMMLRAVAIAFSGSLIMLPLPSPPSGGGMDVALANYAAVSHHVETSAEEAIVLANSRQLQQAVEMWVALNNGVYPSDVDLDRTPNPNGKTVIELLPNGVRLVNPFTGQATEPVTGTAVTPGQIGYVPHIESGNTVGYTITGFGEAAIIVILNREDPSELWTQRFGDVGIDGGMALAVDTAGDVFLTGRFSGMVDFGGGPLTSAGGDYDAFVAKFDSDGAHLWSSGFGDSLIEEGLGIALDVGGNAVLTGGFVGTVDFGGGALTSAGSGDIFVAKYDPSGGHVWSQRFGATQDDRGYAVAVDGAGDVVVTGEFQDSVDFGGGTLPSDSVDVFVAKFDTDGNHVWSKRLGDSWVDRGFAIAVDTSVNVVVTGTFGDTVDFGGGPLTSAGSDDGFVAKYGSAGNHLWSRRFGDTSADWGTGIAVDRAGNVFVTGSVSNDMFLVRYDQSGNQFPRAFFWRRGRCRRKYCSGCGGQRSCNGAI